LNGLPYVSLSRNIKDLRQYERRERMLETDLCKLSRKTVQKALQRASCKSLKENMIANTKIAQANSAHKILRQIPKNLHQITSLRMGKK